MFRIFATVLAASACAFLATTPVASAAERNSLGFGRLLTNDYFGDGKDRWRSGSWTLSKIWGTDWQGQAPARVGDLIELRLSSQILAPENLSRAAEGDRPYAGALSVGVHTHFTHQGVETSLGADFIITGSETGLGSLQRQVHEALGVRRPSEATLDDQIDGGLHPTFVAEMGRSFAVAPQLTMRPFIEGRAGAETLVRAGLDLTFGRVGQDELLVRESVSGQRYRVIQNTETTGFSFLLGADIAHVTDSIFLPESRGYDLVSGRDRVRAGLHWQGRTASAFYGLTYLGEEFEAQTEGQLVGSIRINLSF